MVRVAGILATILATNAMGQATQPATQPALTPLAKYYNLTRTMFTHHEDGTVMISGPEVPAMIAKIKAGAAREKIQVDTEAQAATAQARSAAAQQRAAKDAAYANRSAARKNENGQLHTQTHIGGGGASINQYRTGVDKSKAFEQRKEAKVQAGVAESADDESHAAGNQAVALRARAARLAAVSSPVMKGIPAKEFWKYLSKTEQEQMARVGITLAEFKGLIAKSGWTEEKFVTMVSKFEKDSTPEEFMDRLKMYFDHQLPPKPKAPEAINGQRLRGSLQK